MQNTEDKKLSLDNFTKKFEYLKTNENINYFNSIIKHYFKWSPDNPNVKVWIEYFIKTNERGAVLSDFIAEKIEIKDTEYLDIGCGCGGSLTAFAKKEARVSGMEIKEDFIDIIYANLNDNKINANIYYKDATKKAPEFRNKFNIITCIDVIEHIPNPMNLIRNIYSWLSDNGVAYIQIPNGEFISNVMHEYHHQLFGISLLDFGISKKYYKLVFSRYHARTKKRSHDSNIYDVRYRSIEKYRDMFMKSRLKMNLNEEALSFDNVMGRIDDSAKNLENLPQYLKKIIEKKYSKYMDELKNTHFNFENEKQQYLQRFCYPVWNIMLTKK
jgi:2-polyprenyl-3-methyl-5-hydroxy-6-metoxy-1,4-benzoquinol methylase